MNEENFSFELANDSSGQRIHIFLGIKAYSCYEDEVENIEENPDTMCDFTLHLIMKIELELPESSNHFLKITPTIDAENSKIENFKAFEDGEEIGEEEDEDILEFAKGNIQSSLGEIQIDPTKLKQLNGVEFDVFGFDLIFEQESVEINLDGWIRQ